MYFVDYPMLRQAQRSRIAVVGQMTLRPVLQFGRREDRVGSWVLLLGIEGKDWRSDHRAVFRAFVQMKTADESGTSWHAGYHYGDIHLHGTSISSAILVSNLPARLSLTLASRESRSPKQDPCF